MIWILVFLLSLMVAFLLNYILKMKREINQIMEILQEIKEEGSRQKFLIKPNDGFANMKNLLNEIFYEYENKIEAFAITSNANQHLMTSLSHDIRTPITTLMGYLDAVYMKIVEGEKKEKYIGLAKDKAYDIKEYIDKLFEWFRLNSDEEVFQIEELDIAEKSRQILADWIPLLEEERMEFEIEIPDSMIAVEIDGGCYSRIINNIMQNILAHSRADTINIYADSRDGIFVLRIRDNGIGISEENLKYVFERLYKCDESRHDKGSGLGLNIAKLLTEKMKGTIEVKSELGKGTEFIIEFPAI